jgi:hypothetical protein
MLVCCASCGAMRGKHVQACFCGHTATMAAPLPRAVREVNDHGEKAEEGRLQEVGCRHCGRPRLRFWRCCEACARLVLAGAKG